MKTNRQKNRDTLRNFLAAKQQLETPLMSADQIIGIWDNIRDSHLEKIKRARENTYLKNRIWIVGSDSFKEVCALPGFEDLEEKANADYQQAKERGPTKLTVEDIKAANDHLIKHGIDSPEEIYARNQITLVTPFGVQEINLLPSPERMNYYFSGQYLRDAKKNAANKP